MADKTLRGMEVKVGALILAAVLLLVGFLILLGDFSCRERQPLLVDFPNSGDLKVGAPVKVSGVTVGKVADVDLWAGRRDPEHGNKTVQVRARLELDTDALRMLHRDARFYISTLGVLGEKYVEIDPGTPEAEALGPGDVVDGIGPLRLEVVGADATDTLADVSAIIKENRQSLKDAIAGIARLANHADEMLVENREAVKQAVDNLNRVTGALATGTGDGAELAGVVASLRGLAGTLDRELRPVAARLPAIAEKLDRALGEGADLAAEARVVVAKAGPDIQGIVGDVRTLSRNAVDGKGTIGALLSDREIFDDLIALLKDIKRHPWKLLLKD